MLTGESNNKVLGEKKTQKNKKKQKTKKHSYGICFMAVKMIKKTYLFLKDTFIVYVSDKLYRNIHSDEIWDI